MGSDSGRITRGVVRDERQPHAGGASFRERLSRTRDRIRSDVDDTVEIEQRHVVGGRERLARSEQTWVRDHDGAREPQMSRGSFESGAGHPQLTTVVGKIRTHRGSQREMLDGSAQLAHAGGTEAERELPVVVGRVGLDDAGERRLRPRVVARLELGPPERLEHASRAGFGRRRAVQQLFRGSGAARLEQTQPSGVPVVGTLTRGSAAASTSSSRSLSCASSRARSWSIRPPHPATAPPAGDRPSLVSLAH